MKIGIIGSGNIGGNLGKHWAKAGHEVLFSSRHPEELSDLVREAGDNAQAVSVAEAWEANADAYLLATPFWAVDKTAELYAGEYKDKVIIDATNPYPERDGEMAQEVRDGNLNSSEYVATRFNTARTAKAFNTIHAEDLKNKAWRDSDRVGVPFAAQDERSKQVAQELINDIGFDPVYAGDLAATKAMEVDQQVYGKSMSANELRSILQQP
jgi:predicted dinucleotide-binding enzyme